MNALQNKVAVITGAGKGIGRATALLFSSHGAKIVIADIDEKGEQLANKINQNGNQAIYVNTHVANEADCERLFKTVADCFGRLDIVFNNAGIMHPKDGDISALDEKVWDMTMLVNAKGTFLCCKHAIPLLLQTGGGSVINAASFTALKGMTNANMAYTASKGAILSLTRDLAAQYAKDSIRFNALCPGPVQTDSFLASFQTDLEKTNYLRKTPLNRFASPEEVAQSALFLASDSASYMTGNAFMLDGGLTSLATESDC